MANKEELVAILGLEKVDAEQDLLEDYARDRSFARPLMPRALVRPGNVSEVQAIVQWANQTHTPLVPVSSGPPHFHGDTVPSAPGAVVVDLSGSRQILHIDRRNKITLIEAGVTYPQLQAALAKEGLCLPIPLAPRPNKSVLAALLEREPHTIPRYQWLFPDPLRALELVWGNGEIFRTGDGADWRKPEAWQKKQAPIGGGGPGQTDYWRLVSAAQGTMGIATWASVKCQVLPQIHHLNFVSSNKLENLLDFTYRLLRLRFGDELFILNNFTLASLLGGGAADIKARAAALPPWTVLVGVAGRERLPEARVAYQEKDISDMAQMYGLELLPEIPGARNSEIKQAVLNPSPEPYWKLNYTGGSQDIIFLTTLDKTPEFVRTMYAVAEDCRYPALEIGVYLQPVHQGAACHVEFHLPYNPADAKETAAMQELFTKASEALFSAGAYFSRPYGIWADMVYNRDPQTTAVLKKLKAIFDTNNIMNPGKLCF
ncbi:MAG: FAD-binding oxidoreductase [Dehalococcoidales bacterium]|jgi:FAD/FMN-containing dehydrogenase